VTGVQTCALPIWQKFEKKGGILEDDQPRKPLYSRTYT